jgi:hypothetical protein
MADGEQSFRVFLELFREYDAPFLTKLRMAVHNNMIKARTRKDCCGNHGQPGC